MFGALSPSARSCRGSRPGDARGRLRLRVRDKREKSGQYYEPQNGQSDRTVAMK